MTDIVLIDREDGLAHVRLNRPDKLNSLSPEMFDAIADAGRSLKDDPTVRAVVLSGEGRAFCSGLDFGNFQRMGDTGKSQVNTSNNGSGSLTARTDSPANRAQMPAHIWSEVPVPVIAAIHGYAFGGGLQVALGADIRLVAPDAKLSVMEIKWGLIPDMAGTQLLRRLTRLDVAKELTFTGRIVEGAEAVQLGLATQVKENPVDAALEMAREMCNRSPDALRAGKRLLDASVVLDYQAGLELEEELQVGLIGSPNQIEAVKANFDKRVPDFTDPS